MGLVLGLTLVLTLLGAAISIPFADAARFLARATPIRRTSEALFSVLRRLADFFERRFESLGRPAETQAYSVGIYRAPAFAIAVFALFGLGLLWLFSLDLPIEPHSVLRHAWATMVDPTAPIDKGDTAFLMLAGLLVLAMTVPGLAALYAGLARGQLANRAFITVAICAQISIMCWIFWGYSLAFGETKAPDSIWGGFDKLFLRNVTPDSRLLIAPSGTMVLEYSFITFQMAAAVLATTLSVVSMVGRLRLSAILIFSILWPLLSYYPLVRMMWTGDGYLNEMGAIDFAGGLAIHINAGAAGLIGNRFFGKRSGRPSEPSPPHSLTFVYIGMSLFFIGALGFTAGAGFNATSQVVLPFINTILAAMASGLAWSVTKLITQGKASMSGLVAGILGGLVAASPACGTIGPMGAILLGLLAAPTTELCRGVMRSAPFGDNVVDMFSIHIACGVVGVLAAGVLTAGEFGGVAGESYNVGAQMLIQAKAVAIALLWSGGASMFVCVILRLLGNNATPNGALRDEPVFAGSQPRVQANGDGI